MNARAAGYVVLSRLGLTWKGGENAAHFAGGYGAAARAGSVPEPAGSARACTFCFRRTTAADGKRRETAARAHAYWGHAV